MTLNSEHEFAESADKSDCLEEKIIISEVQLILAEKRTSLAALRTGIAVFALPLSVLGLLVATSKYYEVSAVLHWLVPLLVICAGLAALGGYLVFKSLGKLHKHDRLTRELKRRNKQISKFID